MNFYGVCEKRKYCNHMMGKKILLLMNVHVFCVSEHKTSKKNFVCFSVRTYVRIIVAVDTITFKEVSGFKINLAGVFYV